MLMIVEALASEVTVSPGEEVINFGHRQGTVVAQMFGIHDRMGSLISSMMSIHEMPLINDLQTRIMLM
ncbi:hypothetical protein J2W39_000099 [Variovorax paradoxus]|uniref:Uncharacterized protein n=1 Tax=Variovorax paradoxus TaxID=34073 RepID=A0AAW8E837_VARPD|nr:hypothetical protein [Variovorax paradoxus]MDP9968876.1 hypothetical protein [Variovorax paradoxus]